MSSSRVSHDSSDVTRQIPFEINPAFFPPPTIPLPINEIRPPVEFNYDFKTEHEAVVRYKKELESIDSSEDSAGSRQTTIDIISKLSYLPISGSSKPKVQKDQPNQEKSSQPQNIEPPSIQASAPSPESYQHQQQIIQGSSLPSLIQQQQQNPQSFSSSIPQQQQNIQVSTTAAASVSSSIPIPGSSSTAYAAGLLPTWTPPQLTLDDWLK